jgi:hypothetical protein
LLGLGEALELLEGLVLDLSDPLAGHIEPMPDLIEGARMLTTEAVPKLEHAPLPVAEALKRLAQSGRGGRHHGELVGGLAAFVSDQLAELGSVEVADRLLQRDRRSRRVLERLNLLGSDA